MKYVFLNVKIYNQGNKKGLKKIFLDIKKKLNIKIINLKVKVLLQKRTIYYTTEKII